MRVQDLDGNLTKWNISGHSLGQRAARSSLHLGAGQILKEVYPTVKILEEVPIKVNKTTTLYLDYYIPLYKLAIEVHGEQHYKYNAHFYDSPADFLKAKKNDGMKEDWCALNNIRYIVLAYDKTYEWESYFNGN